MNDRSVLSDAVIGTSVDQLFHYTWRDVILYNISVGAGPADLTYVYEKNLQAIPTFAVIPCTAAFGMEPDIGRSDMPSSHIEGLRTEGTIHMDQKLVLRGPLPVSGTFRIHKELTDLYDRGPGRGAKLIETVTAFDENGEVLFVNEVGSLNRWGGGFGGRPLPAPDVQMPDRAPDLAVQGSFPVNAAVLYRLTGDLNDIHVDPEAAQAARLGHPILHGLCSMGYACRMLIDALLPGQPQRVRSMENQFRAMVTPGESFCLQVWRCTAPGSDDAGTSAALYRLTAENDGRSIIDFGRITWV